MYKPSLVAILLLSLVFAAEAFAAEAEKWYQVEVIIFKRTATASTTEESWIYNDLPATREEGKRLIPADAKPTAPGKKSMIPFQQAASSTLSLTNVKEKLDASNQYEVLAHTGWRQPLRSGGPVTPIRINSDELFAEASAEITPGAVPDEPALVNESAGTSAHAESLVVGNLTLKLSRYLHFAFDVYYKPAPDAKYIAWNDSRRIKLNEANYFDHPLIGMITRVSPIGGGR